MTAKPSGLEWLICIDSLMFSYLLCAQSSEPETVMNSPDGRGNGSANGGSECATAEGSER